MSKHTKGPWFINGNQRYTKYIEARIGGGMIQEVAACGPTEGHGEQEANARLIAAAPELYEELVDADAQMQKAYECVETGRYYEALLHLASMSRSRREVIAKARGEA